MEEEQEPFIARPPTLSNRSQQEEQPRLNRDQILLGQLIVGVNHVLSEVPCSEALPMFGITKCCKLEKLGCLDPYKEIEEDSDNESDAYIRRKKKYRSSALLEERQNMFDDSMLTRRNNRITSDNRITSEETKDLLAFRNSSLAQEVQNVDEFIDAD